MVRETIPTIIWILHHITPPPPKKHHDPTQGYMLELNVLDMEIVVYVPCMLHEACEFL